MDFQIRLQKAFCIFQQFSDKQHVDYIGNTAYVYSNMLDALKPVSAVCLCKDGKPGRDSSPQHRVTVEAQAEGLKEIPKASARKREMSGETSNSTADGDSHTKVCYLF